MRIQDKSKVYGGRDCEVTVAAKQNHASHHHPHPFRGLKSQFFQKQDPKSFPFSVFKKRNPKTVTAIIAVPTSAKLPCAHPPIFLWFRFLEYSNIQKGTQKSRVKASHFSNHILYPIIRSTNTPLIY